jgi:energy-coupling factor transporter ATP-binding protein EcfA2
MSKELFEKISEWKLEAKQEDVERYFYHIDMVDKLINGSRSYVIGRKGSGKTAICEHLNRIKQPKIFTKKLTFKNFPFNDLYTLQNDSYSKPNQYITFWKYLIYTSVAKQMMINENINLDIRTKLKSIYSNDPERSLSRSIKRWVGKNIEFSILGLRAAEEE